MTDPSPSIIPLVEAGADRSTFEPRLDRGFCLKIFLEASSMKPQDDQEPLIPPDASISNPARSQPRLRGSLSSQQPLIARRRPPGNGDDGPPDGDGEPPPPPPPPVSVPDVAMQFSPCLPDAVRADVVRAIRDATGGTADVRALCQNQSERIGLWFRPVVNPDDNAARDRGLQRLSLLQVGETVVFFINSSLIYRTAFDAWNQQPRRLNGDGNPDPNGPIHLTSFSLSFESPNRVVTRIGGFDERPWPDVDFTVAITDTLALSAGGVRCDSVTTLDADTSWLNFLTGLFLIVFPPLGAVFGRANYRGVCRCSPTRRGSRMQRGGADLPRGYDSPRPQGGLFLPAPQRRERRHLCGWILRYRAAHAGSLPHRADANLRAGGHLFGGPHLRGAHGRSSWVTARRLERRRRCFEPGRGDDRHPLQPRWHLA